MENMNEAMTQPGLDFTRYWFCKTEEEYWAVDAKKVVVSV